MRDCYQYLVREECKDKYILKLKMIYLKEYLSQLATFQRNEN